MPYNINRLKDTKYYAVRKQGSSENNAVASYATELKHALYQRVMLNSVEQLRHILQHHDINKVYDYLTSGKAKSTKPTGELDTDKIVPPPLAVQDSEEEEEATKKEEASSSSAPSKPEEKPKEQPEQTREQKFRSRWQSLSKEEIDEIIKDMEGAVIRNKDTSVKMEQEKLRKLEPLSQQERNWMTTSAWDQIKKLKADGTLINKEQGARYKAWFVRLLENDKPTIPSVVMDLSELHEKLSDKG